MLSPSMHVILETTPKPMTKRLAHVALPSSYKPIIQMSNAFLPSGAYPVPSYSCRSTLLAISSGPPAYLFFLVL